ncbi:MAG: HAD-IIIA family hydrolase [Candidatus Cloacimonadota bacterium]
MSNIKRTYKNAVRWDRISLLIFDCDGVLTDGRIIYDSTGLELKNFDAHDGMGFLILRQTEIKTAVITGRSSELLARRCRDLKINYVYQGIANKLEKTEELLKELGLGWDAVAYMGDDWNDIPTMNKAAFSAAPSDALEEIRNLADFVTAASGGRGAVREFIRHILIQQKRYDKAIEAYLESLSQA